MKLCSPVTEFSILKRYLILNYEIFIFLWYVTSLYATKFCQNKESQYTNRIHFYCQQIVLQHGESRKTFTYSMYPFWAACIKGENPSLSGVSMYTSLQETNWGGDTIWFPKNLDLIFNKLITFLNHRRWKIPWKLWQKWAKLSNIGTLWQAERVKSFLLDNYNYVVMSMTYQVIFYKRHSYKPGFQNSL